MGEGWAAVMCSVLSTAVGGGWESSGDDKGFGENVSGEERLMDLGSSGNTYALLEV